MARQTSAERAIDKAFEAGTLRPPPNRSAIMKAHRECAAATLRNAPRPPEEGPPTPEPE